MAFLIIGYGNTLRGDDGAGRRVVEALEDTLSPGAVASLHQLTPEWAETISHVDHVIFVDATESQIPGAVRCFPLSAAPGRPDSHAVTPDSLLFMAAALYGRAPSAHVVTIAGESFALSESLSVRVAAAVPIAAAMIHDLIGRFQATEADPFAGRHPVSSAR